MIKELLENKIKIITGILVPVILIILLNFILSGVWKIRYIYPHIRTGYTVLIVIIALVYITSVFERLKLISRIIKYTASGLILVTISILVFMILWYNYCFFPDDEAYLNSKVNDTSYTNNDLYEVDEDIIRKLDKISISNPLDKTDRDYLLNPELKSKDIYIDYNPYSRLSLNNLKYATGKTFFYVYQKNCVVIKGNSNMRLDLPPSAGKRFIELDAVFPDLDGKISGDGELSVYYKQGNGQQLNLVNEKIKKEIKPDIQPFRYSSVLSSVWFYLNHPGRSVITDDTGWKKIKAEIPQMAGVLTIEFKTAGSGRNYLFAGTPRIYSVKEDIRNRHYNMVYIIFDIFGQPHADLYEYYDEFLKNGFDGAVANIGKNNIMTENIDRYSNNIILFDNVITAGSVTRPSIVALWTSQLYTQARMPVFRNVVTAENQKEFYDHEYTSLGEKLSNYGYLTAQIACNAQGHGVSGVGADLGFDENHDYTMETTEHPANIKNIVQFLNVNQNRKFFLYTHLNIPHPPKWIPGKYFVREMGLSDYNFETARLRANIRYLDFNFKMIMDTIKKLKLDENTFVIITADHSSGELPGFREKFGRRLLSVSMNGLDSHEIAAFHPNAIYVRKGWESLSVDCMQIPFIVIPPKSFKAKKGRVSTYISSLDIAPTILDLFKGEYEKLFSGKSFKYLLEKPETVKRVHADFIPMVGRFSSGFILNGKYKYWWDIKGIYKYRAGADGAKYIQHPEYLFDLETDQYETVNLANIEKYAPLLNEMRDLRLTKYQDYEEKNFLQLMPDMKIKGSLRIEVKIDNGRLVYPVSFGDGVKIDRKSEKELVISALNSDKFRFISFETKPDKAPLKISVYRDKELVNKDYICSGQEKLNLFNNPLVIKDLKDFYITSVPGKTGYEEADLPPGAVYYYRIPVNYWLEMSRSEKDINLSPGIKEVLRGWGYIQ